MSFLGKLFFRDIYAKSFYMLGKIYEQQDDEVKAIEHYEKFLDLWKDADPGIPEVEDPRKRLAGLKELHSTLTFSFVERQLSELADKDG